MQTVTKEDYVSDDNYHPLPLRQVRFTDISTILCLVLWDESLSLTVIAQISWLENIALMNIALSYY